MQRPVPASRAQALVELSEILRCIRVAHFAQNDMRHFIARKPIWLLHQEQTKECVERAD